KVLSAQRRRIQVREGHLYTCHGIHDVGKLRCVTGLVMPGLEVCDLDSTDAEQNAQNFHIADSLRQLRVEAAPALFDKSEVKTRCVDDRLKEVGIVGIIVSPWNCRMPPDGQRWDGLTECVPEIGVLGAATITRPPGGVDAEL